MPPNIFLTRVLSCVSFLYCVTLTVSAPQSCPDECQCILLGTAPYHYDPVSKYCTAVCSPVYGGVRYCGQYDFGEFLDCTGCNMLNFEPGKANYPMALGETQESKKLLDMFEEEDKRPRLGLCFFL